MNQKNLSRRQFIQFCGISAAVGVSGWSNVFAANKAKVVIIGGGAAGTIAAKYLHQLNPALDISLVEKNNNYQAAFMSNQLLSGTWATDKFNFSYQNLKNNGVNLLNEEVTGLDSAGKTLKTASGKNIPFDKLIVAVGAEADISGLDGLTPELIKAQAWTNANDVAALFDKVKALKTGGNVLLSIPKGEINGSMAVYGRVSQIARYLSVNNKKAKIQVLNAKAQNDTQKLFEHAWQEMYPGMIDIQNNATTSKIENVNNIIANGNKLSTDLLNVIPPQKANKLAKLLGLSDDSGWCPVNAESFESIKIKNVHVIGDAIKGFAEFRKNAQMANSQAKTVAIIVDSLLRESKLPSTLPPLIDSEYSIIGIQFAVSSTKLFRLENKTWKLQTNEISAMDAAEKQRQREYVYAESWFNNITNEMFS